jgi:hypothetical protein
MTTTHTPAPPDYNSIPNMVARLQTYLTDPNPKTKPKVVNGVIPIDSVDLARLITAAGSTPLATQLQERVAGLPKGPVPIKPADLTALLASIKT